jgi:hypothetical protein
VTGNWAALWQLTQLQRLRLEGLPASFTVHLGQMAELEELQSLCLH